MKKLRNLSRIKHLFNHLLYLLINKQIDSLIKLFNA